MKLTLQVSSSMQPENSVKTLIISTELGFKSKLQTFFADNQNSYVLADHAEKLDSALAHDTFGLLIVLDIQLASNMQSVFDNYPREINNMIVIGTDFKGANGDLDLDFKLPDNFFKNHKLLYPFLSSIIKLASDQERQKELSSLLLHDLRSPMQSMISYMELIHNQVFGEINTGQKQILANVIALGDNITHLLESLGLTFQFEQNQLKLNKQETDLNDLLTRTLRNLWIQADKKEIKLIPEIPSKLPHLLIDPSAIERVLMNLITNAIQHSPQKSTVQLIVKPLKSKNKHQFIQFRIIDFGDGIPSESINKVFDRYFRLSDASRLQKGQGLGLYISKLIVKAHDGKIGVYNNRQGGSTFYFDLPM
ncbi:MAG: hypothetical protein GF313_15745 [Caldithrix sp.]|nr:hypothetical protein [Caldithrix sp.]